MALLDFIKNRGEQRPAEQQSQQPKPDNAREYHLQQDARDKAAVKPLDSLPAPQREGLNQIRAEFEKSETPVQANTPAPTSAPTDGASSTEPQRQNMAGQDKTAPNLSPTSMQAGTTSAEKETPSQAVEPSSKIEPKPSPAPTTDPTPNPSPRGRGGWER